MTRPIQIAAAIATVAACLAAGPAPAQQKTLRYIPQANLGTMDPVINTSSIVHQHSYMIYGNLFAFDAEFRPQPQMVESWTLSQDGLLYTFKLRDGLKFHDGNPVRAADAVQSIKRWAARDVAGRRMVDLGMDVKVVDDKTFTLAMKEKWGQVLDSLSKLSSSALYVMREKEASVDPTQQITETIGSGPFRFNKELFVPGSKIVYDKNPDYKPRAEPASMYAGGRVVKVDRVEWNIITDTNTATAALNAGEVDIYETPPLDFLPTLKKNKDIVVRVNNPTGAMGIVRPNHLHPPFNNVKAREALLHMVDQEDYMRAAVGSDPANWRVCWAFLVCGNNTATEAGAEGLRKPDIALAKRLVQESGYKGEPVVVVQPTDQQIIRDLTEVTIQKLKEIGFNVDVKAVDWGTMLAIRAKQDPPAQGGWNITHTWSFGLELGNAVTNFSLSSSCDRKGWPGWVCDEETEKLRDEWARAPDLAARRVVGEKLQRRALEVVHFVPLGQFFQPVAFRANVTGMLETAIPVLWNIEKK